MRFKEAYQLIDGALLKANLTIPVTQALKALTFDRFAKSLGKKHMRDVSIEEITASGTNEYNITNTDYDGQIIKVERSATLIPFVGEKNASTDTDSDTVARLGYWTRRERDSISSSYTISTASPAVVTTAAVHGLATGEKVRFSEIEGFLSATNTLSEFNSISLEVTVTSTTEFTVAVDTSSYAVARSGTAGHVRKDVQKIYLNKSADADDGNLKIYYYSAPRDKVSINSDVDIPDLLIWASVYKTVAEFLNLDMQLQIASGFRGLAKVNIDEYLEESRNREPNFDTLPLPMQEFNTK